VKDPRKDESAVVNENAHELVQRFKARGRDVESVMVIVLFRHHDPGLRDFHVAHVVDVREGEVVDVDELFCESAGRVGMQAAEIAHGRYAGAPYREYESEKKS
jgi:hypothetical protein